MNKKKLHTFVTWIVIFALQGAISYGLGLIHWIVGVIVFLIISLYLLQKSDKHLKKTDE